MKCDECTCTYESCSCKLPGSKCAYETDDKKDDGARENEKRQTKIKRSSVLRTICQDL